MMKLISKCIPALLVPFVFACSDSTGPKDNNSQGKFTGKIAVTGKADINIQGSALHGIGSGEDETERGFAIGLGTDTVSKTTVVFYRKKNELPTVKSYTFAELTEGGEIPENDFVAIALHTPADSTAASVCASKSGSLKITSAATAQVKGTFELTATCVKVGAATPYTAKFTGSFNSKQGTFEVPGDTEGDA